MQKWRASSEWQGVGGRGGGLLSQSVCDRRPRNTCRIPLAHSRSVPSETMPCWHLDYVKWFIIICSSALKDLLTLDKDYLAWSKMLTSSNQYLRPDYLSPLPTTVSFAGLAIDLWINYIIIGEADKTFNWINHIKDKNKRFQIENRLPKWSRTSHTSLFTIASLNNKKNY